MRYKSFLTFCAVFTLPIQSSEFIIEDLNRSEHKQSSWVVLPYVFSTESMGLTVGAVAILDGFIQPQMSMVFTAFSGEDLTIQHDPNQAPEKAHAFGAMYAINSYRPSFSNRTFISSMGSYGYYPNQYLYLDGGNDSKREEQTTNPYSISPLKTQGYNNWINLNLQYVLPWGESKKSVLPRIQLRRGIPMNRDHVGGGEVFSSGQTIIGTELFYSLWSAERFPEEETLSTNGIRFFLEHDNTDYPSNPSRGYAFKATSSVDFGFGNSTQSWNSLDFDYKHYIELPQLLWMRQSVLAFNAWAAYSPSWKANQTLNENGLIKEHQTPMWEGAHLGGWDRMRAYDNNRYNDKAALYGAAEYRFIPRLNPMADQAWNPIPIDWFQIVLFAEIGRVADTFSAELLQDMKYDVGFSIRALAAKTPVRFEAAWGEEGSAIWFMLNQPF